ncbi:MAG TPA: chalcone isomerase family protein [Burkholderiaceae bacterium]
MLNRRDCLLMLGAALTLPTMPALARKYDDHEFDEQLQLDGQSLLLNGVGARKVSIFTGYVAALYLKSRSESPEAIYAMAGPKRIEMRMAMGVSVSELTKAVNKSVSRNSSEAEKAQLATELPPLLQNFDSVGKVHKKDRIWLDWLPGRGTQLVVNGKAIGAVVPGEAVYVALLKTFIGKRVSDDRLKAGLLGAPQP